jgi:hypothetical protein
MAAGAATIFRNYLIPFPDGTIGQTRERQIDCLADFGHASIAKRQKVPPGSATARAMDYSLRRWQALCATSISAREHVR